MTRMVFRLLAPSLRSSVFGFAAFVAAVLHPTISEASDPFLSIPDPAVVETTAAYRYANMTNDEAIAELNRRGLPYVAVDPTPGVRAPIRLTGRLHGVLIHSGAAPSQRATSPFEILDARLALALDDFTAILEKHDFDEIEHFSMYRPEVAHAAKAKAPVAKTPEKPVIVQDKPAVEPAKIGQPAHSTKVVKPAPHKPTTNKVATRGKTSHTTDKRHTPAAKPIAKPGTMKKAVPESNSKPALVVTNPAQSPVKPAPKTLGKAKLDPKASSISGDKGIKKKGAGDADELVPSDKQAEIVAEPEATQTVAQTTPVAAQAPQFGTRHPGALAIDVGKLRKKDGTWITVAQHFHGKIGDRACGPDAPVPENPEGRELRALVCEAMGNHLFTYVLTPNYNAAHFDHFHMEVKPGVKWFLVH